MTDLEISAVEYGYGLMRVYIVFVVLLLAGCTVHKTELDETLEWMDNTYNSHPNISGADGHGRYSWYTYEGKLLIMADGLVQTFTYKGCDLTLRSEPIPEARKSHVAANTITFTFNLKDLDPSSLRFRTGSHMDDNECAAGGELNCDHTRMTFSTRNEAGLIHAEVDSVYPGLPGKGHETKNSGATNGAFFLFDDPEYAKRFGKAFARAITLCGGKPSSY